MEGDGGDNASKRPGPVQGITTEGWRPQEGFEETCQSFARWSDVKTKASQLKRPKYEGRECWDQRAGLGP